MLRLALLAVLVLLVPRLAKGQPAPGSAPEEPPLAKNGVYLELAGNGGLYSINYDRRFSEHVSGRAGLMIVGGQSEQATDDHLGVAVLPVMVNYLTGTGSHRLEMGGGPLLIAAGGQLEDYGSFSTGGLAGVTTTFGYRYQPRGGGFTFRAGLTPFYSERPQLWGGLTRQSRVPAEDVAQDAFIRLWKRRKTLDPERSLKALLYTTARHRAFNQMRDTTNRQTLLETMNVDRPATAGPPPGPDETADAELLGARLRSWIAALLERQREAFRLSRFDQLSYKEIAEVMDVSVRTVENHVRRHRR